MHDLICNSDMASSNNRASSTQTLNAGQSSSGESGSGKFHIIYTLFCLFSGTSYV